MNVLTTQRERRIMPILAAVLILTLIVASPMITIVALNALGLSIPFTFTTWLAVLWLHVLLGSSKTSN